MKTVRAIAWYLLLPLMIALFYLEAKMVLPDYIHSVMQILIVIVIGCLAWELYWFDEIERIRSSQPMPDEKNLERFPSYSEKTDSPVDINDYETMENYPFDRESAHARLN